MRWRTLMDRINASYIVICIFWQLLKILTGKFRNFYGDHTDILLVSD